jgi:hypothetical protein
MKNYHCLAYVTTADGHAEMYYGTFRDCPSIRIAAELMEENVQDINPECAIIKLEITRIE